MELIFTNDIDSIKRLDEIMNSYQGRDHRTILAERESMEAILFLLAHGKITITEHAYSFDSDIRSDSEAMAIYSKLAPKTRWRQFERTHIEGVRVNALWQMRQNGEPDYDDDFICYQEGRICAHCGNLSPHQLLMYLAEHERMERLYIFAYPYWTVDHTAKYYCFAFSEAGIAGAKMYRGFIWDKLRKVSEADPVFIKPPKDEN